MQKLLSALMEEAIKIQSLIEKPSTKNWGFFRFGWPSNGIA